MQDDIMEVSIKRTKHLHVAQRLSTKNTDTQAQSVAEDARQALFAR